MDNTLSFTPSELIAAILGVCAAIVTISAAVGVLVKVIDRAKAPEDEQNKRLDNIDHRLDDIDKTILKFKEYFTNDDNRFKAIEKSNKITQTALLALLKHSINGSETEALKNAERSLEEYLIDK